MPYDLESRLVVGVASSAVFDLRESDKVFRREGEEQYRKYQEANLNVPLGKGIAFSFIRRLLSLNDLSTDPVRNPLVEVILLSRNDPDTGMRVMKSIAHHGLAMTRAIFMQGKAPYEYIPALNIALFLSGSESTSVLQLPPTSPRVWFSTQQSLTTTKTPGFVSHSTSTVYSPTMSLSQSCRRPKTSISSTSTRSRT